MKESSQTDVTIGTPAGEDSEASLIRRCQLMDVSAFKLIFQEYEQPLLRSALRITGTLQDAEDAVQTTFIKLYRGIGNFRYHSKFKTYLFRILMNTCFDILKQKHRADMELADDFSNGHPPEPSLKVRLEKAIDGLPKQMRACFVFFAVEGFSQKEISEILEISVGTVKANIFRAREKLRPVLADI